MPLVGRQFNFREEVGFSQWAIKIITTRKEAHTNHKAERKSHKNVFRFMR